ncbi:histidine phosphatase superfamily [Xylariales sp. AK1849]|nr:histidine phosphatase superfamily [Xylariales sp. AK1849]
MVTTKLCVAALLLVSYRTTVRASSCDTVDIVYTCNTSISQSWGPYSPYFSVPSSISADVPGGCDITFVQTLTRHGARDPTASKTAKYNATVTQIQSAVAADNGSYGPGYEFIRNYEYTLGADQLTLFGQQELLNAGIKFYNRYAKLAASETPFFRSSGEERVVESAENFTQGFHAARVAAYAELSSEEDADGYPYDILVISEDVGVNNSLSHSLCTAFEDGTVSTIADDAQAEFASVFAPSITVRLNDNLPGANLTDEQTIYIMDLCPFNTVADAEGSISEWCTIFTQDEWTSYGYYQSLNKWYGYGPGNPLGPTQGVGFVNELIARLTNTSVVDQTSTNSTLDSSAETFPLGLKMYADFTHDSDMTAVYGALGLYSTTPALSNTTVENTEQTVGYSASWTVPFSARMYVEKMTCMGSEDELVRVLVSDRVVPLQGCDADAFGRCALDSFVDSLSFARSGGLWDQCFV